MAFDVMGFLAANGMLPGMQRSAQQSPQQSAPIFNALLEQSVPPQPVPLGIAPSPAPQPAPIGAAPFPAPEPMPLGVATPEMYGPPGGYEPMLRPTAFERELYGAPPAEIMSNQAFGMVPPIEPPTGPVVRPSMSAVNLPPLPPPGFASRRPAPTMGFAQPAAVSGMAPMQPAQTEYPSMFDLFLAAQPDEDLAYNAQFAEEPAAPAEAPVAKQEKDKELESWQPGSVFTISDPADKEGKNKISVDVFTPTSQQAKGSARISTPRGTIYVDESSKLWPQIESRYQQLLGGYQQRAAKDLPTPPSNQYGHAVVLPDGTKAPAMFDANGDMIVEDPTYGSVRMDPTDIDPKNIIFPIDPGTGKPDPTQYQNAIKAIGQGVRQPLQQGISTATGATGSLRYPDAESLSKGTKFTIEYGQYGIPKYTVIDDPDYPPGYAEQVQREFDLESAAMADDIRQEMLYFSETGESIKDARIRQIRDEITELKKIAGGGSSAAMTPTIDPTEAADLVTKKEKEIEDIINGGETLRLGNSVILQVGPAPTLAPSFNPGSWSATSARRRGRVMSSGFTQPGAIISPEAHGQHLVARAVKPFTEKMGGMATMMMTPSSEAAIKAVDARVNNIIDDAVGQFGKSSKLGIKARESLANDPVTFTYNDRGQMVTESIPLQQAATELRDAVTEAKTAMATRSERDMAPAMEKLLRASRRFSGTIDVPYIDGGTTYEASQKEQDLVYSIFQQPALPQSTVTTPQSLAGDTRLIQQQQPIQGEIPRPVGGGGGSKGVPSQIMPIFRIPGLTTDAGNGVGRLGVGSGSAILNTIANAPADQGATMKWLEASGPGKSAGTAIDNLHNAIHADGKPGSANNPTQIAAVRKVIRDANESMQSSPELRKAYFDAFRSEYEDLGIVFGSSRDAFSADLEKVFQGTMTPANFYTKYNTNAVYAQFSGTTLAKSLQELSKHHGEVSKNGIQRDNNGNIIPAPVNELSFTIDAGERLKALVYSVANLRNNVNPAQGNGVFQASNGARLYFFADPYDAGSGQSFLAIPDISAGRVTGYPVMTADQQNNYQQNGKLPPALTRPYDLPALHAFMGLQSGRLFTDAGALITKLTPLIEAKNPGLGSIMASNHGSSGDKRHSINTQRISDDDGRVFGAASRSAGFQGLSDVLVNYSIMPNKRTMFWR